MQPLAQSIYKVFDILKLHSAPFSDYSQILACLPASTTPMPCWKVLTPLSGLLIPKFLWAQKRTHSKFSVLCEMSLLRVIMLMSSRQWGQWQQRKAFTVCSRVPSTVLYTLHRVSHYILIATRYSKDGYQPHCRDEKTEAHRNQGHKGLEGELKFEPQAMWHQAQPS